MPHGAELGEHRGQISLGRVVVWHVPGPIPGDCVGQEVLIHGLRCLAQRAVEVAEEHVGRQRGRFRRARVAQVLGERVHAVERLLEELPLEGCRAGGFLEAANRFNERLVRGESQVGALVGEEGVVYGHNFRRIGNQIGLDGVVAGLRDSDRRRGRSDGNQSQQTDDGRGEGGCAGIAAAPPPEPFGRRDRPREDRLTGEEPPAILGQRCGVCIPPVRILLEAFQADRFDVGWHLGDEQ